MITKTYVQTHAAKVKRKTLNHQHHFQLINSSSMQKAKTLNL